MCAFASLLLVRFISTYNGNALHFANVCRKTCSLAQASHQWTLLPIKQPRPQALDMLYAALNRHQQTNHRRLMMGRESRKAFQIRDEG